MRLTVPVRLAVSGVLGVLAMLGYPPFEWTILSWIGTVGLIWALATAPSLRIARWTAYVYALTFFGPLLWWLTAVELLAFYPMVILQAFPFLIVAGGVYKYRDADPWQFTLAVAGSFALSEVVRTRFPWGGFPWGSLGLTVSSTPLRPAAQWWGASGWSVLLALVAAVIVLGATSRLDWRVVAGTIGLVALIGLGGNMFPAVPDGRAVAVTIVQGNSPCPGTHCPNERQQVYQSHLELTQQLVPGETQLVVWPESSTGGRWEVSTNLEVSEAIAAEAERLGAVLLVGGDRDAGPEHFINVNVVFDTDGAFIGEYQKRHPVPFGETVPLRPFLDWIPALDRVPRDMVRGDRTVTFEVNGVTFASVISYEGAFARYERESVRAGASFIVIATNEASFGESASDQFIAISRLRAAELGVDVVHAAVTGRSAIVYANGRVEGLSEPSETDIITGDVNERSAGATLYTRWGDWLQALAAIGYLSLRVRRILDTLAAPSGSVA